MTLASALMLRTLAFADLDGRLWGAAIGSGDDVALAVSRLGEAPTGHAPGGTDATTIEARLEGAPGEKWTLLGPHCELTLTPVHEAREGDVCAEVCEVSGQIAIDDADTKLDCLGLRTALPEPEPGSLDSFRQVLAWFGPSDAVALSSSRPRGVKGHDRDAVTTILLDADGPKPVDEGRLSTTYAAGGPPARMGLEVWFVGEEEHFPRRVAGEVAGPAAGGATDGVEVSLSPLICHSRGVHGGGAYLIVRPR
jgi:hypothetical protein